MLIERLRQGPFPEAGGWGSDAFVECAKAPHKLLDMEEIKSLWEQYLAREFPRGYVLEGDEEDPIADLAMLDGGIAAWVETFIWKQGQLDAKGLWSLESCRKKLLELQDSISEKNPHFTAYINHLLVLTEKVLEACNKAGTPDSK